MILRSVVAPRVILTFGANSRAFQANEVGEVEERNEEFEIITQFKFFVESCLVPTDVKLEMAQLLHW